MLHVRNCGGGRPERAVPTAIKRLNVDVLLIALDGNRVGASRLCPPFVSGSQEARSACIAQRHES
jgi:hypothetical protein